MKHLLYPLLLMAALGASPAEAKLKIVTTAPDFADLARQIGGDRVETHSVMKGPENVHNVLATPAEMVKLNQADLFVHSGLDTEPWRDNLLRGARNPRVAPGKPGNVDMSVGVELKDVPSGRGDRAQGDMHAYGNPHYTLHPINAQRMTATLAKAMMAVDPANADFYAANAKKTVNELADVAKWMKEQTSPFNGIKVVTFHQSWVYFADAAGLSIVGNIEPKPGITPSPAQVTQLVAQMKQQGVKVVIVETYNDEKLAARVAEAAGAKLLRLPDHVNGVAEVSSYQALFRYNTERIVAAAR